MPLLRSEIEARKSRRLHRGLLNPEIPWGSKLDIMESQGEFTSKAECYFCGEGKTREEVCKDCFTSVGRIPLEVRRARSRVGGVRRVRPGPREEESSFDDVVRIYENRSEEEV